MRLYFNGPVLTMDARKNYYPDGVLVEDEGKILAVGDRQLLEEYPQAIRVDLKGKLLMPGLINCHVHLAQTLLRSQADDMHLDPWLFQKIWPFQAALTTKTFLAGARLAMLDMLMTGTTTFVESMVIHYGLEDLAQEVESVGMRAMLSKVVMQKPEGDTVLPVPLREDFDATLKEAVSAKKSRSGDSLAQIWLGPRWTGMYDPVLMDKVRDAMDEYDFSTTMHYAETPEDVATIRRESGMEPLEFLADNGLMDRKMLLIHGTAMSDKDLPYWKNAKATLVHCPAPAMKGCLGYADIPAVIEAGANVSLGTDSAAGNNTYDLFREMRMAALLHKHVQGNPALMPAKTCLTMATMGGATSTYLDKTIGSLEAGKDADMITIDLDSPHIQPFRNPYSALVYCANGGDVSDVYVRGKEMVRERECLVLDKEKVFFEAREAMVETAKRADISIY